MQSKNIVFRNEITTNEICAENTQIDASSGYLIPLASFECYVERIFRRVCFKSFTFHNFFFIRSPSWPGTHMETGCTHVHSHKCKRIEKLTDILQQKPFSMYVQFVCMLAFATRHETWTGVRRYRENYLNIFFKFARSFVNKYLFLYICDSATQLKSHFNSQSTQNYTHTFVCFWFFT